MTAQRPPDVRRLNSTDRSGPGAQLSGSEDRRMIGWTDHPLDGPTDGPTDRRTDGPVHRQERRTGLSGRS